MTKQELIDSLYDYFQEANEDVDLEYFTFEELELEFRRYIGELY